MELNNGIGMNEWCNLVQRAYKTYVDPVAEGLGLKRVELDVLLFLANNPEHNTATEVVEYCGLVKSHVSVAVNRLEELGYLERFYYNDNRRTIHLELTEKSKNVIEEGRKAQQACDAKLFAGMTAEEIKAGHDMIARMVENVMKSGE